MNSAGDFLRILKRLHETIRDSVVAACEESAIDAMSDVARDDDGDTIYAVDRVSEEILVEFFDREIAPLTSVVLIAEGLDEGAVFPRGTRAEDAKWRVIVDPIDGTRGLMYQKRPGWILTGVAPNRGDSTNLKDIEAAIQTEIPLVKQHLSDCIWAEKGSGARGERFNRLTGERSELRLESSKSTSIAHGFASIARFFPGMGTEAAEVYEELVRGALGPVQEGKAQCFEDQYISSAGQLFELMSGHDRFVADLRPVFEKAVNARGAKLGICSHPYDLCTELIAREAGVTVTNETGDPLDAPLALEPDVAWIGYANESIRAEIEPHLTRALRERNLI